MCDWQEKQKQMENICSLIKKMTDQGCFKKESKFPSKSLPVNLKVQQ